MNSIQLSQRMSRMCSALAIVVLSWGVGLAQAEWLETTRSTSRGLTTYIDPTTIHIDHKHELVKMWALYDFKTVQKFHQSSYLSLKSQQQYDCTEGRSRTLAQSFFEGNMGDGDVVFADSTERSWNPVAPGSMGESLWRLACLNVNH